VLEKGKSCGCEATRPRILTELKWYSSDLLRLKYCLCASVIQAGKTHGRSRVATAKRGASVRFHP